MENFLSAEQIEFLARLFMALAMGFLLGLERELTNKYAGLRTHILVCLGACIFTLLSIYGFPTYADGDNLNINTATGIRDTSRVAAQIVTGIGFIGAGTVLRNGPMVFGLTTAATLWIAASIGMACGAGLYGLAILATVASVAVLTLIRIFEKRMLPSSFKHIKRYKLSMYCNGCDIKKVYDFIVSKVDNIREYSSKRLIENSEKSKISVSFELCNKKIINDIYKELNTIVEPDTITIQELND